MKKLLFLLALLSGLVSFATDSLAFKLSDTQGGLVLSWNGQDYPGRFYAMERGKAERLPLKATAQGDKLTLQGSGFQWDISLSQKADLFSLEGSVRNLSEERLLLELGMEVEVAPQTGDRFWGGFDVLPITDKPLARKGFKGRVSKHVGGGLNQPFPTASLVTQDRAVILGQRQFAFTSYNAASYTPTAKGGTLGFCQRLVIEPGKEEPLQLACGVVPIRYGAEENVVEAFYMAFPENWRPFVGPQNRYIRGIHSQYNAWARRANREFERRSFATLDWAYTPYKRSGDFYGTPKYWDYKPLVSPFARTFAQLCGGGDFFDYNKLTCEQFHAKRQDIFRRLGRMYGYSFYFCAAWCEEQLALQNFPEALVTDKDVPLVHGPWSTHHDRERRIFILGTPYEDFLKESLKKLVFELDLPGFAVDCGTPGVNYYGPGAQNPNLTGRSWDDQGVFIDELCAINQLSDFIHRLRPEDPPYVWKNGTGMTDMTMIETDLFSVNFQSWMPLTRYNIGQRPAVLHVRDAWMFDSSIPNWRNLTLEQFLERWAKLGDHASLSEFEYGMTQSLYGYGGNRQSQYDLPELLECINLGWHALIPVATPELGERMLYRSRYGFGADTILFFGNPYNEPIALSFHIDNRGLSGRHLLFLPKMRDAATMRNEVGGDGTVIRHTLPSRRPVLFEAVAELDALPQDGSLAADVSARKSIDRLVYRLALHNKHPFKARLTPRRNPDFEVTAVLLNGQPVKGEASVEFPANSVVEIQYASQCFHCKEAEITSFPFLNGERQCQVAVELPADPTPAELDAADRIVKYFQFASDKKIIAAGKPVAVLTKELSDGPAIAFRIRPGEKNGVFRQGNRLLVTADDQGVGYDFTTAMTRVMDKVFPWWMDYCSHSRNSRDVGEHFHLHDHPLPWSPCFESE
ncbi:MAG: hypothetical protein IJJ33_17750 [Victivallales bacterium]|nr:hypothetical protein [Victivallales bacterium]